MNLSLFGYGITAHFYRRGKWHRCEFKDCPSHVADAEIKYVIVRRDVGGYSERFDTREDAQRALNFLRPSGLFGTFDILETVKGMGGTWMIGDPTLPSDQIFFINNSAVSR